MHKVYIHHQILNGRRVLVLNIELAGLIEPSDVPHILTHATALVGDYVETVEEKPLIVINGRMPIWLAGSIAYVLSSLNFEVAMYDPKLAAAVTTTGELIKLEPETKKECKYIFILGGPPKSGKTTIKNEIMMEAMYSNVKFYSVEANVDMEGFWTMMAELPDWVRPVKRELVKRFGEILRAVETQVRNLIDNGYMIVISLGGLPSKENEEFIRNIAAYAHRKGYRVYLVVLHPFIREPKYEKLYAEWLLFAEKLKNETGIELIIPDNNRDIINIVLGTLYKCGG